MSSEAKCPKCGAELRSPNAPHRGWVCGSYREQQSDDCRIAQLTRELDEARAEFNEARWKASDYAEQVSRLIQQLTAATTRAEQAEAERDRLAKQVEVLGEFLEVRTTEYDERLSEDYCRECKLIYEGQVIRHAPDCPLMAALASTALPQQATASEVAEG